MSHLPEDERAQLVQEMLTTLMNGDVDYLRALVILLRTVGPDGLGHLARNRDTTLRQVARLKSLRPDERVPDADINNIEHRAACNLAVGKPGPIFARWDFARD